MARPASRPFRRAPAQEVPRPTTASAITDLMVRRFNGLSANHKRIVQFIIDNPRFASLATVRQLAAKTDVDPATITRMAKALGFAGFQQFRQELRSAYLGMLPPLELMAQQRPESGDVYRAMILRDIQNLNELLRTYDRDALDQVVSLLLASRHVLVISSGSYAAPAVALGQLCLALGIHAEVETRSRIMWAPRLAALTPKDLVIGISFWRGDPETVAAVQWAASHGLPTVAITDSSVSPLGQAARYRIVVPTEGMLFFQSVTASLSVVYGLVAAAWMRLPASRREVYSRIRKAFDELKVFT